MTTYTDLDGLGSNSITFGCDLSGTSTCQTVIGIQGNDVSSQAPTNGQVLQWNSSANQWQPTSSASVFTAGGDLSGTSTSQTVIGLQGRSLVNTAPSNNQVILWNTSNNRWEPTTLTFGGDLSGTYPNPTVAKINGASVPASGSLTTGNVLQVSGASALSYGPVNLAGGADYVTGTLPVTNLPNLSGDVTGALNATVVGKLQTNPVNNTVLGATQDGYVLTWVNGSSEWQAKPTVTPITWSNDLDTSTDTNQYVSGLSGPNGTAGTITMGDGSNDLSFIGTTSANPTAPRIFFYGANGEPTGAGSGGNIYLRGGTGSSGGAGGNGGHVYIEGGEGVGAGVDGNIIISGVNTDVQALGGTLTLNASTITLNGFSTGLVHSTSGVLSSSLLVNADVSASAAIAVSKLAAGTAGQILLNNSTPTPTWTTISQDISITNAGVVTLEKLRNKTLASSLGSVGADQDGYALVWVNASSEWQAKPSSAVTFGGDLSGNTTSQTVEKIKGTTITTAGGSLATGAVLRVTGAASADWGAVDLADTDAVTGILPVGNQAAQTLAGDASGTTAAVSVDKIKGNAVQALTLGAAHDGYVLMWDNVDSRWEATKYAGDVTGTPAASVVVKINGTSVDASPSADEVLVATSSTVSDWKKIVNANVDAAAAIAYSKLNLSGSIVNADVSGSAAIAYSKLNLSGSIVNADISGSAAIDVAKLAAGSSGQVLLTTGATTTWNSTSGDATISGTGVITVSKIKSTTITTAGGSLATGAVLRVTGASTADWGAVDLADTDAVTGVLPEANQADQTMGGDVSGSTSASTVDKLKGKSLNANIGTAGAGQDQYSIVWDNASTSYKLVSISGSSGVTTVGTIDSQTKSANGLVISGVNIYAQTADATYPGLVSTGTQTIAGAKTFSGTFTTQTTTNLGSSTTNNTLTGGIIRSVQSTTSNITCGDGYWMVAVGTLTGGITVTLPSSPATGREIVVKDVNGSCNTYRVTVSGGSNNIDSFGTSFYMASNYESKTFVYTGSKWSIV